MGFVDNVKMFFAQFFHNLKTSSKTRLRLFLAIVAIALVVVFTGVQIIRMIVSVSNPKWTTQFVRPGDGWSWYPQIAVCPYVYLL